MKWFIDFIFTYIDRKRHNVCYSTTIFRTTSGSKYSGRVTYIVALPVNISKDEIYKPFHEDKTIGIFTYFAVKDSNGKSKFYPSDDYVIIGGKSLNISR
jgi:hypothetical protein